LGGACVRKGRASSFCAVFNLVGIVIGICFVALAVVGLILLVFFTSDFINLLDFSIVEEIYEQGIDDVVDLIDDDEYMMTAVM
jgi:hypothetical protein